MLKRGLRAAGDLARFGARYAGSAEFRSTVNVAASSIPGVHVPTEQESREAGLAPTIALPHRHLSYAALALAVITAEPMPRSVNLVVSEFDPARMFAGVSTALDAAAALADELGAAVRLVVLSENFTAAQVEAARQALGARWPGSAEVVQRSAIAAHPFGDDDVWMVTHWTTAHPAQVAALAGVIDRERVVYLVQDFEPGFSGWSTQSAVARSTYDAGFALLVNSSPLARYLGDGVGLPIDVARVFAPEIPVHRIRHLQATPPRDRVRVMFYGRPSKPRNLFDLGVAALDHAAASLTSAEVDAVEFVSAGERHPDIRLGGASVLRSVGTLGWDEYFTRLAETDVVLSLQASPHPSHPPLEAAMSGAIAVTNDFEGTRGGLHPRLAVNAADPASLGDAVVAGIRRSFAEGRGGFMPIEHGALGGPLRDAVRSIASALRA